MIEFLENNQMMYNIFCLAIAITASGIFLMFSNREFNRIVLTLSIGMIIFGSILFGYIFYLGHLKPSTDYESKIKKSTGLRVVGKLSEADIEKIDKSMADVLLVDDSNGTIYTCKVEKEKDNSIGAYFEIEKGKFIKLNKDMVKRQSSSKSKDKNENNFKDNKDNSKEG